MVCTEGEEYYSRSKMPHSIVFTYKSLHSMQNACRIIHHAKGVDYGTELVVNKPLSYVGSETGANEEHLLHWLYLKRGSLDVYYCPKLHIFQLLLTCNPRLLSVMSTNRALGFWRLAFSTCFMRAAASGSFATM